MMRSFCSLIFVFAILFCRAQEVVRTFLPVNPKQEQVKVLATEQSTFVIKMKADQSMEVIAFDADLQELWGIGVVLKYPELHVAEAYSDELALLISDVRNRQFALLEIDAETGHYAFSEYSLSTSFRAVQLARNGDQFWAHGWISEEPVAFQLSAATKTLKTLPLGHASPVQRIHDFGFDPDNQELDLLLTTREKGYQAFLHRSINPKGEITRNQLYYHPKNDLMDLRLLKTSEGLKEAVGTLGKKKSVTGVVRISETEMEVWELDDIRGLRDSYILEKQDLQPTRSKGVKSMKADIDGVSYHEDGELMIALETYEKDYEVRGLLQRESDEQSMIDQIDLNRYGRRDFDPNESTLNDRVDNFSNTEAATYRFRDVIIDRVQEQGNRHSQTLILSVKDEEISGFHLKMPKAINSTFSIKDQNLSTPSYVVVDNEGLRNIRLAERPELKNHNLSLGPYLNRISRDEYLNFGFILNEKVFYLMVQRIGLETSSD